MLTPKQQKTLEVIEVFKHKHGRSPTMTELAHLLGIRSRGLAHRYVKELEQQGYLSRTPHRWCNIQLKHPPTAYQLPILGKIAAGAPIEAIEQNEDLDMAAWFLGPDRYALKVEGDSMIEEGILHGDIIVCQKTDTARAGQIVVALIDQEQATLKRIDYPDQEHVRLIPANQAYEQQIYHASRVLIQGIFVGLLRLAY